MPQKKATTSAKAKAKAKPKAKSHAKPKAAAKPHAKAKPKAKARPKAKAHPKTRAHKPAAKHIKTPVTAKKKKVNKVSKIAHFSEDQKAEFLISMANLVHLHKFDKDGLKTLTQVDRILDHYNQKYTDAHDKFDAIIEYGIKQDPTVVHAHFYMPVHQDKELTAVFKLLGEIGKDKINYDDAKSKLEKIVEDKHKEVMK